MGVAEWGGGFIVCFDWWWHKLTRSEEERERWRRSSTGSLKSNLTNHRTHINTHTHTLADMRTAYGVFNTCLNFNLSLSVVSELPCNPLCPLPSKLGLRLGIPQTSVCESVSEKILQTLWLFRSEIIHLSAVAKPRRLMNKLKQTCENKWCLASNVVLEWDYNKWSWRHEVGQFLIYKEDEKKNIHIYIFVCMCVCVCMYIEVNR